MNASPKKLETGPPRAQERRWIAVAEDGRHSTLGRATDPTSDDLRDVENGLRAQGAAEWLAMMEGNPYEAASRR